MLDVGVENISKLDIFLVFQQNHKGKLLERGLNMKRWLMLFNFIEAKLIFRIFIDTVCPSLCLRDSLSTTYLYGRLQLVSSL